MAKLDARMDMIGSAVRDEAQRQAREIIDQANAFRDAQIKQYEENLIDEMCETVQHTTNNLRYETRLAISSAEREAYRAILKYREGLARSIFDSVTEKLRKFTATPEYREKILNSLERWKNKYGDACAVSLRPQDMEMRDQIAALLPGCNVRESAEISVGGYILEYEGSGVRIDETLETLLHEQKPWFLQHCHMQVQ